MPCAGGPEGGWLKAGRGLETCGSRPTASNCTPWPPARPMGSWSSCCTASRSSGRLALCSALAAAGLRVVAPDLRGYNLSAKPEGISAYLLDVLADDVWAWPMPWATAGSPSSAMTGAACWPGTWPRVTPAASSARPSQRTPPRHHARLHCQHPSQLARSWYVAFSSCPACPSACCAPATTPGSPTASPAPAVPARSATPTSPTTAAPGRSPAHSRAMPPGTVRCACSSRQRRPCGSRSRSR